MIAAFEGGLIGIVKDVSTETFIDRCALFLLIIIWIFIQIYYPLRAWLSPWTSDHNAENIKLLDLKEGDTIYTHKKRRLSSTMTMGSDGSAVREDRGWSNASNASDMSDTDFEQRARENSAVAKLEREVSEDDVRLSDAGESKKLN